MNRALAAVVVLAFVALTGTARAQTPGLTNQPSYQQAQVAAPPTAATSPQPGDADPVHAQASPAQSQPSNGGASEPAPASSGASSGDDKSAGSGGSGDPARMPKTASPYPLIALLGIAAIAAAVAIGSLSRRRHAD